MPAVEVGQRTDAPPRHLQHHGPVFPDNQFPDGFHPVAWLHNFGFGDGVEQKVFIGHPGKADSQGAGLVAFIQDIGGDQPVGTFQGLRKDITVVYGFRGYHG